MVFLRILPRNLLSRGVGRLARMRRPRWVVLGVMRWFARRFELDMTEAARPLEEYGSLVELFTRRLRAGVRTVDATPGVVVSPVDGALGAHGRIEGGRLIQAKGLDYSLEALLGSREAAAELEGGWFGTFYLAPTDYHRIHVPADGVITRTTHEPGTLWPVNGEAVRRVPSLFAVNERVAARIETAAGPVVAVMVGATNVGSIRLAYCDLVTNRRGRTSAVLEHEGITVRRGDDLGVFELGSTVILLVGSDAFAPVAFTEGDPVRLGMKVGIFR